MGKEAGSLRKARLVVGTRERQVPELMKLMARQQFTPERAVGRELAQKRVGSMLSVGQAPVHV